MKTDKQVKVYSVTHVIKMLPYLKSFCSSLIDLSVELKEISKVKPELLQYLSQTLQSRRLEIIIDLEKIGAHVCNQDQGLVDVPFVHPGSGDIMMACVSIFTTGQNDIHYHHASQQSKSRRILYKVS